MILHFTYNCYNQPSWIKHLELQPKTIFSHWPLHSFMAFLWDSLANTTLLNAGQLYGLRSEIEAAGLKILHTNEERKESHCIENSISFYKYVFH